MHLLSYLITLVLRNALEAVAKPAGRDQVATTDLLSGCCPSRSDPQDRLALMLVVATRRLRCILTSIRFSERSPTHACVIFWTRQIIKDIWGYLQMDPVSVKFQLIFSRINLAKRIRLFCFSEGLKYRRNRYANAFSRSSLRSSAVANASRKVVLH